MLVPLFVGVKSLLKDATLVREGDDSEYGSILLDVRNPCDVTFECVIVEVSFVKDADADEMEVRFIDTKFDRGAVNCSLVVVVPETVPFGLATSLDGDKHCSALTGAKQRLSHWRAPAFPLS